MTQRDIVKRHGGATALARRLGVHKTTVCRWQRGAVVIPKPVRVALCYLEAENPIR
jgi:DNA-binding transcriptional regulator YdaS (Cro superfamily)